ncbi:uncharacterized protein LOC119833063 [Zerene cesonia]|uniref:uncharacterized protein LOC119833063 n=1 Tax=Zerene cesonia TaxID=33412 RepID=UPI0018E53377|nr:uncharacterized protein LOC119833063 [Zerene cesonia]
MENERFNVEKARCSKDESWRRKCGCLRTSEKLKRLLDKFPAPPPPSPDESAPMTLNSKLHNATCISAYCTQVHNKMFCHPEAAAKTKLKDIENDVPLKKDINNVKSWRILREMVQLLQFSVTATALALYYLVYCYMQLIYYTLWSAVYFHNADGPMKITITIVTITSMVIAFNLILKFEKIIGIGLFQ